MNLLVVRDRDQHRRRLRMATLEMLATPDSELAQHIARNTCKTKLCSSRKTFCYFWHDTKSGCDVFTLHCKMCGSEEHFYCDSASALQETKENFCPFCGTSAEVHERNL